MVTIRKLSPEETERYFRPQGWSYEAACVKCGATYQRAHRQTRLNDMCPACRRPAYREMGLATMRARYARLGKTPPARPGLISQARAARTAAEAGTDGKWCRMCFEVKPRTEYSAHPGQKDLLMPYCRPCRNGYERERRHRAGMGLDTQH